MVTKKTTSKKAPTKKATSVRVKKSAKPAGIRAHIGLQPEEQEFMTFRLTKQTVYWLILGVVVVLFAGWTMMLQADIQSLYDQIDEISAATSSY